MGRAVLLAFALVLSLTPAARTQGNGIDLKGLLDTYYQGRYDEAVAKAAAIPDLGPFRLRFVQDSPVWVNADPARIEARSAAAAAFLLEITAARLESDWGRFSDLIEWTCVQLRTTATPTEFERSWHAASHALAGRARDRNGCSAFPRGCRIRSRPNSRGRRAGRKQATNEPPPATHLMHALERFPDDPQFQLSRVGRLDMGPRQRADP